MKTLNKTRKELLEVIELLETTKNPIHRKELLKQEEELTIKYKELKND